MNEMLPVYLADDEHEWFRELPDDIKNNYELLKGAFASVTISSHKVSGRNKTQGPETDTGHACKTFIKQVQREARCVGLEEAHGVSIILNNLLPAARCTIITTPTTYSEL